jgi:hypothetical protein
MDSAHLKIPDLCLPEAIACGGAAKFISIIAIGIVTTFEKEVV